MQLVLHVHTGSLPARLVHLEPGRSYLVGRMIGIDICLPDDIALSRRHCRLRCGVDSAWVCDVDSMSGTRVNQQRLNQVAAVVHPDDVIEVGDSSLRLGAVVPVERSWLVANGGSVVRLAEWIEAKSDYALLPVLADALEDAGCDNVDILAHCRAPHRHTSGCWVIDLVLGRTGPTVQGERPEGQPLLALLADVHGNLEALQAVYADIEQQGIERIYSLGDMVGYGPNPLECLELIRQRCAVALLGNFELATLFEPENYGETAAQSVYWTRAQLEKTGQALWPFLGELPRTHVEPLFTFVHGSPRNPLNEYVFPEDIYNLRKLDTLFSLVERYCCQGHTHLPGIWTTHPTQAEYEFLAPEEFDFTHTLSERKTLCNVGSVGQPRDGDSRACYVVREGDLLHFRRIEYDLDTTVRKIYAIPALDNFLGNRLREGR